VYLVDVKRTGFIVKTNIIQGLILFLAVILASCSGFAVPTQQSVVTTVSATYQTLSIDELAGIVERQREIYTVVNVHIPYAGEIEGTDLNVPFNDPSALAAALPDKDTPIILYCRSGAMSAQAAVTLSDLGYTQIYDVPGGMNAWTASGHTLIDN